MHPEGIPQNLFGRCLLLSCRDTGAKLMVMYERLFDNGGDADHPTAGITGIALDGIYVVKKVRRMRRGKEVAVWKRVADDESIFPQGSNRSQRFGIYLSIARTQAIAVDSDVDLRIHESNIEQMINMQPTANGTFFSTA